ncbi:transamidase GatB domain protein [Lachnospiraceae bacterium KM106-2]|nr:transamidase GatB domain protein [Lachnospiraceae bacterium KM106-2]
MTKIEQVRAEMVTAMKEKNKPRKDALSMLLSVLKNKAIDKRADLTEEEENEVVLKEIKQTQETLDTAPAERTDIIDDCKYKIEVYKEFAPKFMSEDEIKATIQSVLDKLGITAPTAKDKGKIMKELMPLVKGKADGKLVNQLVSTFFGA